MIVIEDTIRIGAKTYDDTIAIPDVVELLATESGDVITTEDDINYITINR